jgi:hypothetical protein
VKLVGIARTGAGGGSAVPGSVLTVTVPRMLFESVTMIVASVRHVVESLAWSVKRPGCVMDVLGVTVTLANELTAV